MKFTESCKRAVNAYMDGVSAYETEKAELENRRKAEEISGQEYELKLSEIRGTDTALYAQLVKSINDARDAYIAALPNRYARNSETIDVADLELLESKAANLSPEDVQRMFEKHADSLGMQGAIVEANAKRPDPASLVYFDQEKRKNDAQVFAETMINAARTGGLHAAMAIKGSYVPVSLVNE